jgi:hypothetical protein
MFDVQVAVDRRATVQSVAAVYDRRRKENKYHFISAVIDRRYK